MRKFNVMFVLFLCVVIFAGSFLSGCSRSNDSRSSGGERNSFTIGLPTNPASLDPSMSNDQPSARVRKQIYDTLINTDENMVPIPSLAERWVFENDENGEATRLRLFLKRGVKFHNGEEFKASDVKFTLERAASSPVIGHITGMIETVDIINDYEVLVSMPYPFAPILNHLAHTATSIVNEKAVRELGDNGHSQNPIGTGPMKFVNWQTGARISLTRWDDYHGTLPRFRDLIFRIIPDPATRLLDLESGGVDVIFDLLPSDMSYVQGNPALNLIKESNLATHFIAFNCQMPPFNDIRVRQAISYALDVDSLVRAVYFGTGNTVNGPINSRIWASASDRLQPYEYNPERARQLLTEAGFPNGFSTILLTSETSQDIDTAEIAQNMLRQVGINVEVQVLEWAAFLDATARGDQEMFTRRWVTVTGDPDYGLYAIFHSSNFGAAGNRSFYSNPEVDRLLFAGRGETNRALREQLYFQAQQIIRDEAAAVFKWAGEELHATRANVRGFGFQPGGHHILWTLFSE